MPTAVIQTCSKVDGFAPFYMYLKIHTIRIAVLFGRDLHRTNLFKK